MPIKYIFPIILKGVILVINVPRLEVFEDSQETFFKKFFVRVWAEPGKVAGAFESFKLDADNAVFCLFFFGIIAFHIGGGGGIDVSGGVSAF